MSLSFEYNEKEKRARLVLGQVGPNDEALHDCIREAITRHKRFLTTELDVDLCTSALDKSMKESWATVLEKSRDLHRIHILISGDAQLSANFLCGFRFCPKLRALSFNGYPARYNSFAPAALLKEALLQLTDLQELSFSATGKRLRADTIARAVIDHPSLKHLVISYISFEGTTKESCVFEKLFLNNSTIETLELKCCEDSDLVVKRICQCLAENRSSIRKLRLHDTNFYLTGSFKAETQQYYLGELCETLGTMLYTNSSLIELQVDAPNYLYFPLGLVGLFQAVSENSSLRRLDLGTIRVEGICHKIRDMLRENSSLEELKIHGILSGFDLALVLEGARSCVSLHALDVRAQSSQCHGQYTVNTEGPVCEELRTSLRDLLSTHCSLKTFKLAINRVFDMVTMESMMECVATNKWLKVLELSLPDLDDDAGRCVRRMLEQNNALEVLRVDWYIRSNGDSDVMEIAMGLRQNHSLRKLCIDRPVVIPAGLKKLAETLVHHNTTLASVELLIADVVPAEEVEACFLRQLPEMQGLQTLHFYTSRRYDRLIHCAANALEARPTLVDISFGFPVHSVYGKLNRAGRKFLTCPTTRVNDEIFWNDLLVRNAHDPDVFYFFFQQLQPTWNALTNSPHGKL